VKRPLKLDQIKETKKILLKTQDKRAIRLKNLSSQGGKTAYLRHLIRGSCQIEPNELSEKQCPYSP